MSHAPPRTGSSADGALREYWESYYAAQALVTVPTPSQFAVFVQSELVEPAFIADIGCGTGKDALFFSSHGHAVAGVDAAQAAVDHCTRAAAKLSLPARFLRHAIGDPELGDHLRAYRAASLRTIVYARFFLHAISEESEAHFLDLAASLCGRGDLLAVEFRTVRDRALEKVTHDHYRRYLDPPSFLARAYRRGYVSQYFVEGFGFAKYKSDDAYVARCLLEMP